MLGRDSETRRRRKDSDRDSPKTKDKERHRSSKSSRKSTSSSKDPDRDPERERTKKPSSRSHSRPHQPMSGIPELERRASSSMSLGGSKTSLPYPSFSKAHCRESVGSKTGSKENLSNTKSSPYTPDATDVGDGIKRRGSPLNGKSPGAAAPPSPPLTADDSEIRRSSSGGGLRRMAESDMTAGRKSTDSISRLSADRKMSASRSSLRESTVADGVSEVTKGTEYTKTSDRTDTPTKAPATLRNLSPNTRTPARTASVGSFKNSAITTDSDATSVAPDRKATRSKPPPLVSNNEHSPLSAVESSPRTPMSKDTHFPTLESDRRGTPMIEIFSDDLKSPSVSDPIYGEANRQAAPPPPPPPPPPAMVEAPRVDYLLQHGGLNRPVARSLLSASVNHSSVLTYQQYNSPRPGANQVNSVRSIFQPLETMLDDYTKVLDKHGSIAVATGYRSVARRLLDRLEAVFARNISQETCPCIMCRSNQYSGQAAEGVSWGEILEFVCGRRDLPPWPPFHVAPTATGLGINSAEHEAPMQKVDIDVPDEYREHYIRQNKKTKSAVQNWLANMPEEPRPEMDDDTYAFAMLTQLKPDQKQLFTALHRGMSTLPVSRTTTPLEKTKPELLRKTALALQRLYRLGSPPRDPECTMFLLKHPELHGVLVTLAAISTGEWDILVSGRFDGFLWSGAEAGIPQTVGSPPPRGSSRGPTATPLRSVNPLSPDISASRGPTPFSPGASSTVSRGPTPAPSSFGAPVQMDEETEVAVLAEVEREIYIGMEALEDAFEALHAKAETVRAALRERSAALAMTAQARRGSMSEGIEVRLGTPASACWDTDTDDGIDDDRSELAPDDSASNISYGRRKRPARRERRTPAPVLEEDETEISARGR